MALSKALVATVLLALALISPPPSSSSIIIEREDFAPENGTVLGVDSGADFGLDLALTRLGGRAGRKVLKSKTHHHDKHGNQKHGKSDQKHGKSGNKHGHSRGGNSLEKRLAYKQGEFSFSRHSKEKLYPSSGPIFPGRGNLAIMKHIVQSSYKPGFAALTAVDGDQYGFYEEHHSYAATKSERNPWMHLTLSEDPVQVASVEIWFPVRKCEQYLKNLSTEEKKKWIAADKAKTVHKLPWRCQYSQRKGAFYQPSAALPLEVAFKVGENVVGSRTFTKPVSVVTWNAARDLGDLVATSVLVRIKGTAQLSVAEIKVFSTKATLRCGLATCKHGSCRESGECSCDKDWIGEDCSVNIRGDTKYMSDEVDRSWWDEAASQRFYSKFKRLQGKEYCSKSVAPHLLPGPAGMGAGLGSTMYYRMGDLSLAMSQERGYNYVGYFNYARNEYCKGAKKYGEFSCYFEENPNCEAFVAEKRSKIKFPAIDQKNAKGQDCLLPHQECKLRETFNDVPSLWSKKDLYWWRVHQTHYLFALNSKTRDLIDLDALKKEINFQGPIIGVHMRSGDGCRHGVRSRLFRCRTLQEYLPEINALAQKYDTKNVFIATDNPQILDEIATNEIREDLNFAVVPSKFREELKSAVKIEQRMTDEGSTFDNHAALISAFQDILLLAECDYLVTHQASTMSRIALNLATMRKKFIPPFISLDGPWCPQWRMCCEPRHDTGEFHVC